MLSRNRSVLVFSSLLVVVIIFALVSGIFDADKEGHDIDIQTPIIKEETILSIRSSELTPIKQESYEYLQYDPNTEEVKLVNSSLFAEYYHAYIHSVIQNQFVNPAFYFELPENTSDWRVVVEWWRYDGADNVTLSSGYVFELESRLWFDVGYKYANGVMIRIDEAEITGVRAGLEVFEFKPFNHTYGLDDYMGSYWLGVNSLSTEFNITVVADVVQN